MDELDRLFTRLVQSIGATNADLLTRPFEVAQIYQTLVPYRLHRRDLQLETMEEYELTLLRLLSGERGYLMGDGTMQSELRAEIDSQNPDLTRYRAYATTDVQVAPEARRALDGASGRRTADSTAITAAAPPTARDARSERATLGMTQPPPPAPPRPAAPVNRAAPPAAATATTVPATMPEAGAGHTDHAEQCRYCGGELPDGRSATFCPHCGQNLTVRQCPACGTELDVAWKFCITCGRSVA